MKDGLIFENEELIYYKNGEPYHAGVIKDGEDIYYISSHGRAIKGQHVIHREMTNGILERGVYTFGEDYKLVPGSFVPPEKRKKKRNKRKPSRKAQKAHFKGKPLMAFGIMLAVLLVILLVPHLIDKSQEGSAPTVDRAGEEIHLPELTEVLLCSATAKQLYDGEITADEAVTADSAAYRPLNFDYSLKGSGGSLYLSERSDMKNAQKYILPGNANRIVIDNLKTGTTYYWEVQTGTDRYAGQFETVQSTRFLTIPGVENTRDIGGYVTQDGKTVKQGLLIRGTEFDGLVVNHYFIPKNEINAVQETFGFVCDFDLRGGGVYTGTYQSRLGKEVAHKFYGAPQYGEIFNHEYLLSLKDIFTDLAKAENYPMYMHCTYGADRTGTVIFLLQGVLNMSQEDMIREYQRTGFAQPSYRKSNAMDVVIEGLNAYEGDTLQERVVRFLQDEVGITEEQIESIREILLTES